MPASTLPDPLPFDALDLPADAVEARFRWARERGHPAYLWPGVPIPAWRAALETIEAAATAALTDGPAPVRLELPRAEAAAGHAAPRGPDRDGPRGVGSRAAGPRDGGTDADTGARDRDTAATGRGASLDPAVRALGVAAFTSGMGPLLGHWLEAGRLEAAPDAAALLRLHLEHARRRARKLDRELYRVLDVLAAAGARPLVIKGAHTARAYFPEPAARPSADIDLVVEPSEVDAAERALADAGYRAEERQPQPYSSEWRPPDSPRRPRSLELVHAGDPYSIDLHASLERDFFGVRTVRLAGPGGEAASPWPELHPSARVLQQPVLAAYLAAHASEGMHNLTLIRLVELVLVLRADAAGGRLRWDELHALLRGARALRFVHPAFELAERLAPGTVDPDVRATLAAAAPPRMVRVLDLLRPAGAQRVERLSLAERFIWCDGPVDHLRRLRYMLWPRWIGGSLRQVGRMYVERFYRLLRGRVGWGGGGGR